MADKEIKYIVFKRESLDELCEIEPRVKEALQHVQLRYAAYRAFNGHKVNNYIVCNQDEPYADTVWKTILDGEDAKSR